VCEILGNCLVAERQVLLGGWETEDGRYGDDQRMKYPDRGRRFNTVRIELE
jgi:hypothetical protein